MKLHKLFGINGIARSCFCCGKIIGYTPIGDMTDEDLSTKKQLSEDIICKECIDKLNSATCFIAGETDENGNLIAIYDTIWIENIGLKEFFKDTSYIQPVNILTKEGFYNIFGNVINEFNKSIEDENNKS